MTTCLRIEPGSFIESSISESGIAVASEGVLDRGDYAGWHFEGRIRRTNMLVAD
jgi:hypothetical protein